MRKQRGPIQYRCRCQRQCISKQTTPGIQTLCSMSDLVAHICLLQQRAPDRLCGVASNINPCPNAHPSHNTPLHDHQQPYLGVGCNTSSKLPRSQTQHSSTSPPTTLLWRWAPHFFEAAVLTSTTLLRITTSYLTLALGATLLRICRARKHNTPPHDHQLPYS